MPLQGRKEIETKAMTNEDEFLSDPMLTCADCDAACCRLDAMLFGDPEVPEQFVAVDAQGRRSMARLKDGWCAALDRTTLRCTIYEQRPWICREFEVGEHECLSTRAGNL